MEPIATLADDWLAHMKAKVAQWAEQARADHEARMATLPPGTCERCYGTGRVGHLGLMRCACQPDETYAAGTPYEFHDATLANYRVDEGNRAAFEKAQRFLAGTRDLYIVGGVGAGKTRLACAIANEAQRKGLPARFVRVPMMLHQLQPGRSAEAIAALEDELVMVPLLVLDDLGAERDQATDFTRRTLLMVYEARHDRGGRTIFTSNKTVQALGAMQEDDRLASRIAGRCDVVRLTTSDQRMRRR